MKTTIVKSGQTKYFLIVLGIGLGLLVLNTVMENVASWLAFYF